jgi:tRNA pseudouridine(55) synthase
MYRRTTSAVLTEFVGEIDQVPPMYSALKRDGKPLYEYARAGIDVERKARRVVIHEPSLGRFTDDALEQPFRRFRVRCSKGTYVRTLAADIGERLGCGAHSDGASPHGDRKLEPGQGAYAGGNWSCWRRRPAMNSAAAGFSAGRHG